jgi:peptidyl-dipeptidase Dcp
LPAHCAAEGQNHAVAALGLALLRRKAARQHLRVRRGELKPYLQLEKSSTPASTSPAPLFGITFVERPGIVAWHPDVRVFEIRDRDGDLARSFLGDYFARSSKRSGAWMSAFQSQHRLPAQEWAQGLDADHLQCLQLRQAGGRQAGAAVARRCAHAVPRIRPRAAWHADHVTYPSVSGTGVSRATSSNCPRSSTSTG